MLIGLDFDNTLICYDLAFSKVGKSVGLIPADAMLTLKPDVKKYLLQQDSTGKKWETLQGLVYGRHISEATLFPGVINFIRSCRASNIRLKVISHKTHLAHHDPQKTNLRHAALEWMTRNGFFLNLGFKREDILFGGTREEKLSHIRSEQCNVFIDDLPEVLQDSQMPEECRTILFRGEPNPDLEQYSDWKSIGRALNTLT